MQVDVKNGATVLDVMMPLKPALHEHPSGTLVPVVLPGQATGVQVLLKYGVVLVETTVPLYPELH